MDNRDLSRPFYQVLIVAVLGGDASFRGCPFVRGRTPYLFFVGVKGNQRQLPLCGVSSEHRPLAPFDPKL